MAITEQGLTRRQMLKAGTTAAADAWKRCTNWLKKYLKA